MLSLKTGYSVDQGWHPRGPAAAGHRGRGRPRFERLRKIARAGPSTGGSVTAGPRRRRGRPRFQTCQNSPARAREEGAGSAGARGFSTF